MTRRCLPPVVVRLGTARTADLAALEAGEGPLVDEVREAERLVRAGLAANAAGKIIVPLVVAYTRPRKVSGPSDPVSER